MQSQKIPPLAIKFLGSTELLQESSIGRSSNCNPLGIPENPATQPKLLAAEDSTTTHTLHRDGAFHAGLILITD